MTTKTNAGADTFDDPPTPGEIFAFEEWYNEIEVYSLRSERIASDVFDIGGPAKRNKALRNWMLWAFIMGGRTMNNGQ